MFFKIRVLKNFAATLLKRDSKCKCFPVNIAKSSKTTFFKPQPQSKAFHKYKMLSLTSVCLKFFGLDSFPRLQHA